MANRNGYEVGRLRTAGGICSIKQELLRPEIFIEKNSLIKSITRGVCMGLTFNPHGHPKIEFTEQELDFFSKKFKFETVKRESGFKLAKISNDPRFALVDLSWVVTNFEKEYIIIQSKRWQFDYQPRSAGEDQLGEDVTYIHGIWENPELPESIMKKIKGEF